MKGKLKKTAGFLLLIFSVFLINSCGLRDFAVVTDNYWDSMIEKEYSCSFFSKIPGLYDSVIVLNGKLIKKYTVNADNSRFDQQELLSIMEGIRAEYIILSPLLTPYADFLAENFKHQKLILNGSGKSYGHENIFAVDFDFSRAFFECGEYTAGLNLATAAVFFTGNENYKNFLEGWEKHRDVKELETVEFANPESLSIDEISMFCDRINETKEAAVIFAGPYTGDYLDGIDSSKVILFTENLKIWSDSGITAAGSVDLGALTVLSEIVKIFSTESYTAEETVEAEFFYGLE